MIVLINSVRIDSGADVQFVAGDSIKLNPGFWVKAGATFRAVATTFGNGPPEAKRVINISNKN